MLIKQIIAHFLAEKQLPKNAVLLDVRSPAECAKGIIEDSLTIPVAQINAEQSALSQLDKTTPIIVYCASGGRAVRVRKKLKKMGFKNVVNGGSVQNVAKQLDKRVVK